MTYDENEVFVTSSKGSKFPDENNFLKVALQSSMIKNKVFQGLNYLLALIPVYIQLYGPPKHVL